MQVSSAPDASMVTSSNAILCCQTLQASHDYSRHVCGYVQVLQDLGVIIASLDSSMS